MNVDSNGRAVSEGTYGRFGATSARVSRTYSDPTVDGAEAQKKLAKGGYELDFGKQGTAVIHVDEDGAFVVDDQPTKVIAQDGQTVEPGDQVTDGKTTGTVKNVWPTSAMLGINVVCSIEEKKGGAPDGHFAFTVGTITKVVKAKPVKDKQGNLIAIGDVVEMDPARSSSKGFEGNRWLVTAFNRSTNPVIVVIKAANEVAQKQQAANGWGDPVRFYDNALIVVEKKYNAEDEAEGLEGEMTMGDAKRIPDQRRSDKELTPKQVEAKFGKLESVKTGTQLVVPSGMSFRTAAAELIRQAEQEEMEVAIQELVYGFPLDAAHAFVRTLEKHFGWVNAMPTPGFFGPEPPKMIGVEVSPHGDTVQIPWGRLALPGIQGFLTTGIAFVDKKPVFQIGGKVKQMDKDIVNAIAKETRNYLASHSIYRGQAIRVKFPEEEGTFNPMDNQPKFMQVTDVNPEELIFSKGVGDLINVNLWTLINHLPAVRRAKIPVKRGVLVHGRYGVGKTLLATVTAKMSVQNGVTFIDLVDSTELPQAIAFARTLGGPVCIFAEDIDRCDDNGTRTDAFNEILNTVDGLVSKSDEVITVMTTNHIERISPAMLRPGRLDAVIHIAPPDADAVERLIRLYARDMLERDENISQVCELLAGEIPAAVREVVERSKLGAISRGEMHRINSEDLYTAAVGLKAHLDLIKEKPVDPRSELVKAGHAVGKEIAMAMVTGWAQDGAAGFDGETVTGTLNKVVGSKAA